jgi:TctA family transporter
MRTANYTWVPCVADVDFEGGDVRDALATLLTSLALQNPSPDALLGLGGEYGAGRVLPFERAPEAFGGSVLEGGGTAVIRVVLWPRPLLATALTFFLSGFLLLFASLSPFSLRIYHARTMFIVLTVTAFFITSSDRLRNRQPQ